MLILIVVGGVLGYHKGILSGIGRLVGLLVGIIACRLFGTVVGQAILSYFPDSEPYIATILAYIVIFFVFFFGIRLVAHLLKETLKTLKLGVIDRIGGAFFGVFKWLLMLSILLNAIYAIAPDISLFHSSHLFDGKIFELVMRIAPWAWGVDIFPSSIG